MNKYKVSMGNVDSPKLKKNFSRKYTIFINIKQKRAPKNKS